MINITSYNLNQRKAIGFGNGEKSVHSQMQIPKSISHAKPSSNSLMKGFKTLMIGAVASVSTLFSGGCGKVDVPEPTPPSPPKPGPDTALVVKDNRTVSEKAYQWLDSLGIKPTVTTKAGTFSDGDSLVVIDEKLNQKNAYGFHPNAKGDTIHVNMTETDLDGKYPAKDFGKMYQKNGNILMDVYEPSGKFSYTFELIKDGLNVKRNEFGKTACVYKPTNSPNQIIKTIIESGVNEAGSRIVKIPYYLRK